MSTLPFVSPGGFVCVCFSGKTTEYLLQRQQLESLSLYIYKKIKPNEPPPPQRIILLLKQKTKTRSISPYTLTYYIHRVGISVSRTTKKNAKRTFFFLLSLLFFFCFLFFVFGLCIGCISYSLPLTTLLTREKRLCDNNNKSIIIIPLLSRERLIKSRKSTSKKREAKVVSSTTTHVVVVVFALHIGVS